MPAPSDTPAQQAAAALPRKPRTSWNRLARRIVQDALAAKGIPLEKLAEMLEDEYGHKYTANSLSARISRGTFTLAFFLQLVAALNIEKLDLVPLVRTNK